RPDRSRPDERQDIYEASERSSCGSHTRVIGSMPEVAYSGKRLPGGAVGRRRDRRARQPQRAEAGGCVS
uniref:hypothetical protein n=1 Tax=Nocardia sp. CNY236 TaxID=1169152 RepID=UPI001E3255F1